MASTSRKNELQVRNNLTNEGVSEYKLVLIGMYGVGKSSLVVRFMEKKFNKHEKTTVGVSFCTHTIFMNGKNLKFQIWDTAGDERFHSLIPLYYRNSNAAIVVYDIQNRASYDRAKFWVKVLQNQNPPISVIALAGNKAELEIFRAVECEEVEKYAKKANLIFMETSAKTGANVDDIFSAIARKLSEQIGNRQNIGLTNDEMNPGKCC